MQGTNLLTSQSIIGSTARTLDFRQTLLEVENKKMNKKVTIYIETYMPEKQLELYSTLYLARQK